LLASAHDINPVPVGFALHALMVVSSAHEVLRQVPAERRALPALFCVHDFKQSQARSRARSEWVLPPRKRLEGGDPERALAEAFRTCDKDLADDAITALHGTRAIDDVFELLWRRGAWPLDNLGHRAILVAQAQRALLHVGADAAEPVLRTVARALAHTARDADLASGKASERLAVAAPGAFSAPPDPERSRRWLAALRDLDEQKAPAECARLLAEAAAPATLWDGIRLRAFELMMQHPGIAGLHAVTTVNALHEAARRTSLDGTRTFALLQAAAWCARFQKALGAAPADALGAIDELAPAGEAPRAADLLGLAAKDRAAARAGALALDADGQRAFAAAARDCLVRKASEAHAYKFTSAALEEVGKAHPRAPAAPLGREPDRPAPRGRPRRALVGGVPGLRRLVAPRRRSGGGEGEAARRGRRGGASLPRQQLSAAQGPPRSVAAGRAESRRRRLPASTDEGQSPPLSDDREAAAAIRAAFAAACAREGVHGEIRGEREPFDPWFAPQQSAGSALIAEHFARELLAQGVALREIREPGRLSREDVPRILRGLDLALRRIRLLLIEHNSFLGDGLAWPFAEGPERVRRRGLAIYRYPSHAGAEVRAAKGAMLVELSPGELGPLVSAGFYLPAGLRGDFRVSVEYELERWDRTSSTASLALLAIDGQALCRYHAQRNSQSGHEAVLANLQGELGPNHAVTARRGWFCLERAGHRVSALHREDGGRRAVTLGTHDRDEGQDLVIGAKVWGMDKTTGARVAFRALSIEQP
jgi:hypothetical protein